MTELTIECLQLIAAGRAEGLREWDTQQKESGAAARAAAQCTSGIL